MRSILHTFFIILSCTIVMSSYLFPRSHTIDEFDYLNYGGYTNKRSKRAIDKPSSSQDTCKNDKLDETAKKLITKNQYPLTDDRNIDLQLVWSGKDAQTEFLLTTTEYKVFFMTSHKPSILYQSTNKGFTFKNVQEKIKGTEIRSKAGIMKSPINKNKLIFISYLHQTIFGSFGPFLNKKNTTLLITENGGNNFTIVDIPFTMREEEPLLFHPTKENWIIALEKPQKILSVMTQKITVHGEAWISKDFGKTWKVMMKGHIAQAVKWGANNGHEGEEIYLSTEIKHSTFSLFQSNIKYALWKSTDGGHFFEEIVEHCYNFGVQGNFVFASVAFNVSSSSPAETEDVRRMYVSKDSGKTFRPVDIPEVTPDRFYAVVEMFKDLILLHVDEIGDTGQGTLYISDADGLKYTKSLENHFYTNTGFTDFAKIESMPGVYITQILAEDKTLKSVITFDRGIIWQPIYLGPEYCKDKGECTLHYHSEYSKQKGVPFQAPLSSSSAPGIVFLHGLEGDGLTGAADVWLSINGGYNWTRVAKGPHHYSIGDNGNLLVIIPMLNSTGNTLKYSIDMGRCWNEFQFADLNSPLTIRGLVTEPHSQERVFSLWGYRSDIVDKEKEWIVITINFHDMFTKKCVSSDYDEWYPHALNGKGGCLLGEKTTYLRPKLDATCYLGKDFNPFGKVEKCPCTNEDLECDYGWDRQSDGTCKRNKHVKLDFCKDGETFKWSFSLGYRRTPGDTCTSAKAINDIAKSIDEGKKCEVDKTRIEGVISKEKKELAREKKLKDQEEKEKAEKQEQETNKSAKTKVKKKKKSNTAAVLIGIVSVIAAICITVWYIRKRKRDSYKATFSMRKLHEEESDEESHQGGFDPRPKSHRPYKDESEAEDDMMLSV